MHISPTREEFRGSAEHHRLVPVFTRVLADAETPLSLYRKLAAGRSGAFLFESASQGQWDRYSFIGRDPVATLTEQDGELLWLGTAPAGAPTSGDVLTGLHETMRLLSIERPHAGLPPMISSFVGYLGWDFVRRTERLGPGPEPVDAVPELSLSVPGDVAIYDHYTSEVTLVANVVNVNGLDSGVDDAYDAGCQRLEAMLTELAAPLASDVAWYDRAEPQVSSRTDRDDYLQMIERAKGNIVDGDVFQVVLSQRFEAECTADPLDVYRLLRTFNPSPYMYLLDVPTPDGTPMTIVGSSPEALVTVTDGKVETHPIAGSRPRGATAEEDRQLAAELLADEKERAEHLMLVDLARNDLSKVCRPGSVDVVNFMEIERYSHIMHIGSTVVGTCDDDVDGIDVLSAVFPAGTLSGAPKPRALQLIDDYETVARGVYGGAVGYLSFTGDLNVAIAIRTGVIRNERISVSAGAGVVADSVPASEDQESRNKAAAVLRAAAAAQTLTRPNGSAAEVRS
ncbi:anthranilate synthase component I [Brevibacterium luteolum]|uniref:Anthranilate synthase component 1 n=1 Tax=Brevibacterium luteolum TaxID=199591 RepID=A0A6G8KU36_9MICO|nr:anthranilate synthase component I [Brevibacterium luteolum]QIN28327.1 anthranilate synthase component I [Brevibacterium luteolum]